MDEPSDIDLVLVLPEDWDLAGEVSVWEYNLVDKRRVRQEYGFHVFAVNAGSDAERTWTTYFQKINPKWEDRFDLPAGGRKGLLRVTT